MLKLQYFGPPDVKSNSLEKTLVLGKIEGRRRREWQRMRYQGSLVCCGPRGSKVSDMREQLNDNNSYEKP